MPKTPYMPLYTSDYLGDTGHLSTEEHGAYLLILMQMWNAGGKLPNVPQKLARIARCSTKKWKGMANTILEFFDVENGQIFHARQLEELQKVHRKSDLRRAAGAKGGKAKALKTKETGLAKAKAKRYHTITIEDTNVSSDMVFEAFDQIWDVWSKEGRRRSKRKDLCVDALKRQLKHAELDDLVRAAKMFCKTTAAQYQPALDRWLTDGRWESWIAKPRVVRDASDEPAREDWEHWTRHLLSCGEWIPSSQPAPGHPECKIPKDLLETIPTELRRAA